VYTGFGGSLELFSPVISNTGVSINQAYPSGSGVLGWDGHTWTDGVDIYTDPTAQQIGDLGLSENYFSAGSFHNARRTNVVGFRYTVVLDPANTSARTLTQTGIFLRSAWSSDFSFAYQLVALDTLTSATVNVIPAPGVVACGIVTLGFGMRRRHVSRSAD
jgi:hypothetical protein